MSETPSKSVRAVTGLVNADCAVNTCIYITQCIDSMQAAPERFQRDLGLDSNAVLAQTR
jgi:hypothetical protein